MDGKEILRIVEAIHIDKSIDKEIVFEGIEQAILSAARKHFGEEAEIVVDIDRSNGEPSVSSDGEALESEEIGDLLGRIAAQTAKQVMIQKIREAERDSLHEEFDALRSHIVTGTVSRMEHGSANVNLGKVEAILPRGEQIPGEGHRVNERVRAVVLDVRKAGSRVKIILSRTHPDLVRRLFEIEIPEVADHVIEVRSLAREAGYRSKVAVSCYDAKIDAVGACVGVRGARIRGIVDELAGERIDIVRWNDSLNVLVPNALQPAEVEDVILCPMLGKVIVLVHEDQLSLAIGRKGQNVRLASKLVGWDIHVLTQEKLDAHLDESVTTFAHVPEMSDDLAENLVAQGFFTFDDLSVIEPDQLAELGNLTAEQCDAIIEYADEQSLLAEQRERQERQDRAAMRRLDEQMASMGVNVEESKPQPAKVAPVESAPEGSAASDSAADEPASDESESDVSGADAGGETAEETSEDAVVEVEADAGEAAGVESSSESIVDASDLETADLEAARLDEDGVETEDEETADLEAADLETGGDAPDAAAVQEAPSVAALTEEIESENETGKSAAAPGSEFAESAAESVNVEADVDESTIAGADSGNGAAREEETTAVPSTAVD